MTKHNIERQAPEECRVPENIPPKIKYRCIVADPPWAKNQSSGDSKFGSARNHYPLMSLDRIKQLPVADLADDNAHLYLWAQNGNIDEALEVIEAWGFRYITQIVWLKIRMGMGNYIRNVSEPCLFAVRGKLPPKCKNQIGLIVATPTGHSEKPRGAISLFERVSPGPYLELFCRRRPASTEKWDCWGNETEGGSDIYVPGFPVPVYKFETKKEEPKELS